MDILKSFLRKFIILILFIICAIFLTGEEKIVNNNELISSNNEKVVTEKVTIKKGAYIEGPRQEKISKKEQTVNVGGIKVNITKLAKYDITGIVLDTEKYNDVVGPIDVGLAWGKLAENNNYKKFTSCVVKNRTLTWMSNNSAWIREMGGENEITKNCSNNHLIPANDNIRKEILKINKDEYVRLTGYLVRAEWNVGNTKHVWGPSSLSRTDTGNNSCEIMYVETIDFL
ncbi:MAG: hypothetical protein E7311_05385 [Clostridiales bacterium]|nr:hypothetical protein [Clostridiales bacterium]